MSAATLSEALRGCQAAAERLVRAADELTAAREAWDDCLRAVAAALDAEGKPRNSTATVVRDHLTAAGWTSSQLAVVGISDGTVKLATRYGRGRGESPGGARPSDGQAGPPVRFPSPGPLVEGRGRTTRARPSERVRTV